MNGLLWSATERFSTQTVTFIVGIILARLLSPEEFGLIGMLTIFIGISTIFVQSGFNQALIRKTDCTEKDYATVFYFNLFVALVFYSILVLTSGFISDFYKEPILRDLIKVLGLTLIINALSIVQYTKIVKRVDFKLMTKVTLIASIGSGALGITMAATGFGVWSLVFRQITQRVFETSGLWIWNKWKPHDKFSKASIKELWAYSGNLVLLASISAIYKDIYNVIIGKFYPAANLGFFTSANHLRRLSSETIGLVVDRVNFPVLSSLQDNEKQFISAFNRIYKSTMLISFFLLIGLAAFAKEFVVVLMGEQWLKAGEYLQILCFVAIFYPFEKIVVSILKVVGRSDIILKIGLLDKLFAVPLFFVAIFIGIKPMLYLMIVHRMIYMVLLANKAKIYIDMTILELLKKMLPSLIISFGMFGILFFIDEFVNASLLYMLLIKIFAWAIILIGFSELIKFDDYLYLKMEVINKLKSLKNERKKRLI